MLVSSEKSGDPSGINQTAVDGAVTAHLLDVHGLTEDLEALVRREPLGDVPEKEAELAQRVFLLILQSLLLLWRELPGAGVFGEGQHLQSTGYKHTKKKA